MIGHQLYTCVLLWICVAVCCATDTACTTYNHPEYGTVGKCIPTASCPEKQYKSRLCPSFDCKIRCCFTANNIDKACATHDHPTYGKVGYCTHTSQCPDDAYVPGLCPSKCNNIKCCFKRATAECGETVKNKACNIKDHPRITLWPNNKGNCDGADAHSNIIDTCDGKKALRSSYSCKEGTAPGGSVCLSEKVLEYILSLANEGHSFQVNAISGSCHSNTSWHYQGTAVDLQIRSSSNYKAWQKKCGSLYGVENLGPGSEGHSTHTHCAFNNN